MPRGELPATPLVVAWNDSVIDPSRAPEGKHLKKFVVLAETIFSDLGLDFGATVATGATRS